MLPLLASLSLGQAALGGIQALTSGRGAAEKDFENFAKKRPLAKASPSLDNYYQQALSRYNENPYQSQQYQVGAMNAQRATAQGIGALQDRRSAIGGIGRLAASQNAAMQNLGVQAEAQRNARFGQLGGATQMKTAQDKYLYDVNQATPFNTMLGIKQMKSAAANERFNAGLNMIGSAAGNYAMGSMYGGGATLKDKVSPLNNPLSTNIPGSPYGKFSSLSSLGTNLGTSGFKSAFGKTYQNNIGGLPQVNNYPTVDGEYYNNPE